LPFVANGTIPDAKLLIHNTFIHIQLLMAITLLESPIRPELQTARMASSAGGAWRFSPG
jgi:hypothetical protein